MKRTMNLVAVLLCVLCALCMAGCKNNATDATGDTGSSISFEKIVYGKMSQDDFSKDDFDPGTYTNASKLTCTISENPKDLWVEKQTYSSVWSSGGGVGVTISETYDHHQDVDVTMGYKYSGGQVIIYIKAKLDEDAGSYTSRYKIVINGESKYFYF